MTSTRLVPPRGPGRGPRSLTAKPSSVRTRATDEPTPAEMVGGDADAAAQRVIEHGIERGVERGFERGVQ